MAPLKTRKRYPTGVINLHQGSFGSRLTWYPQDLERHSYHVMRLTVTHALEASFVQLLAAYLRHPIWRSTLEALWLF